MTPREKTVVRAIAKALRGGKGAYDEMDALALSYEMPHGYEYLLSTRHRAIIFLISLADDVPERKRNDMDAHKS